MLSNRERKKILGYFGEARGVHFVVVIIYFVLLALTGVVAVLTLTDVISSEYTIYAVAAFVLLLVPLIVNYLRKFLFVTTHASDRDFDEQYLKLVDPDEIIALGKEKFGFDKDTKFLMPPVIFHNYADEDDQSDLTTPFMKKRGSDGMMRSSHIVCLAYFFGEDILFQFGYAVDICGDITVTVCDDIYYRDISRNIKVSTITAYIEDEKGHPQKMVREKIIMPTKSHGEIRIPYWSSPTQKEAFDKMRRRIREINTKAPAVNVEVKYD